MEKYKNLNSIVLEMNKAASSIKNIDENSETYRRDKFMFIRKLSSLSEELFSRMANHLNSFGARNIENLGLDYKYMPIVFYMFLYSIYFVDKDCRGYFSEDGRSEGTAKLAYYIMRDTGYFNHFGNKNNWVNDSEIMEKGISNGVRQIHKTLIQSIARCFLETMHLHQKEIDDVVPGKQSEFMNTVLGCIYDSSSQNHMYLPFI